MEQTPHGQILIGCQVDCQVPPFAVDSVFLWPTQVWPLAEHLKQFSVPTLHPSQTHHRGEVRANAKQLAFCV